MGVVIVQLINLSWGLILKVEVEKALSGSWVFLTQQHREGGEG